MGSDAIPTSLENVVGLAMHLASLKTTIASIHAQPGSETLKALQRSSAQAMLERVEANILELLDEARRVPQGLSRYTRDVARMNAEVPFENSVFLMTKFPDRPGARLKDRQLDLLALAVERAVQPYGLIVRRADRRDYSSSKQLWDNVVEPSSTGEARHRGALRNPG